MARGRGIVVAVGGGALVVGAPLAFTLGSPEAGDAVSASIIAATAVAALALSLWPGDTAPDHASSDGMVAARTGPARASRGGDATSGVRGGGGAARAEHTGPATAHGPGSRATSGIDQSKD